MSQSLYENILLVILTAILTGLLVPIIKNYIDERTFKKQKLYEADLARQAKLIDAQSKFLDDISEQFWLLRYLLMAVAFYKMKQDEDKFTMALKEYEDKTWNVYYRIRMEISKSRRLVSEEVYQRLVLFYHDWLNKLDIDIRAMLERKATINEWQEFHDYIFNQATREIDAMIHLLSVELKLAVNRPQPYVTKRST